MSSRLLRKVLEDRDRLPASSDGEDSSPPATAPARNPFDLLDEFDGVDKEDEGEEEKHPNVTGLKYHEERNQSASTANSQNHKYKKKKKRNKERSSNTLKTEDVESIDSILEELSIGRSAPPPQTDTRTINPLSKSKSGSGKDTTISALSVLAVDAKHLKAENELRKVFGSKVVDSFENQSSASSSRHMLGGRRVAHSHRRTILISPPSYWPRWDGSMSMELMETKNATHNFRYVHTAAYGAAQEIFEAAKSANDLDSIAAVLARCPYHVDSLLTYAELFKFMGEHQQSADAVEKCLFALECAWHPMFSPLNGNCRLKFIHATNKPLFIALFHHMRNLDRRGCHRTALEVCKFLLSLDLDDPKGALFCIDYFALRAQEYSWLESFAEEYHSDNSLWLFPNFSYSLAIARYYLEQDTISNQECSVGERSNSIDLMKQALMLHPLVLQKLVAKAPLKDSSWTEILKNTFFGASKAGSPSLEHMINIYVERSYILWRFPELQTLLKDAAFLVIESIKQNSGETRDWACVRKEAFSSEKNEYSHLMVSDFSDTVPSLPPEELRPFMIGAGQGARAAHQLQMPDM